ncbi:MAG TPA: ATP-binding protein [Candidatus Binatia bacterium]|nr:ATP-binding protein [Candidatus Binatia bacterium]
MQTAFLISGSTGAGKTTYSRKLANERGALVFSIDEWMKTLFWMDSPEGGDLNWALARVRRCESQIWVIAQRLLDSGLPVVLDLGFSKKDQRDRFKSLIISSGHQPQLHFLDVSVATRRNRVKKRNLTKSETFEFSVDEKTFDWMESYFERPTQEELVAPSVVIK